MPRPNPSHEKPGLQTGAGLLANQLLKELARHHRIQIERYHLREEDGFPEKSELLMLRAPADGNGGERAPAQK